MPINISNQGSTVVYDARYVLKAGDTMTGQLTITPATDVALEVDKQIILEAGQKLIFDGA